MISMAIKKEDRYANHQLRFIEMLLLIASILFGIGKVQNNLAFIWFIIFAILYYVLVSNKIYDKYFSPLITFATACSFSAIVVIAYAAILPPSELWISYMYLLYFIGIAILLFFALNGIENNRNLFNPIKKYFLKKKK